MGVRILIVDDEKDLCTGIQDYIMDESSHKVFLAFSGEQGLKELELVKPQVCIVDMRLPGMTGNEFIMGAYNKMASCKFIVHTGSMDYILPEELKKIGISEHFVLNKPVPDMIVFLERIHLLTVEQKKSL